MIFISLVSYLLSLSLVSFKICVNAVSDAVAHSVVV